MNHELAKTLTIALVNYIDKNRPEGTMDCSSAECKSIEEMFEGDQFDIIEAFIQKKLSSLTEFEKTFIERVFHKKIEDLDEENKEMLREGAHHVLAFAREQLIKDGYIIEKKAFYDAVEKVSPEVMKEVSDNVDKKEKEPTEFQEAVRVMITKALTTHIKDGNGREMSSTVFIDDDTAILLSEGLLKLAKNELLSYADESNPAIEAMADLERTYFYNPDKLPKMAQG